MSNPHVPLVPLDMLDVSIEPELLTPRERQIWVEGYTAGWDDAPRTVARSSRWRYLAAIDLSPAAFSDLADTSAGRIRVTISDAHPGPGTTPPPTNTEP